MPRTRHQSLAPRERKQLGRRFRHESDAAETNAHNFAGATG
ncbi:MAG: hypothetical protein AVDCRST_MAG42-1920 [uncultured Chthoniobacterales bacterium]|uniref:Uncharacterized protein n=1 Tax=uncultured Chthoniobacterales bacterium TaxID=1836801 RepID=A0A6J4I9Q9_9BACT|nr:MAG: hypothetical protein AVDCRST_MAG42-1920 [uncultured Chthoniobacterales bacterium]